jgi:hypothetical protein
MHKRSLSDWAAIAEIAATVAIFVSLIFVVISIRQNTAEIRLQNENLLFELQDSAQADFVSNPWLVDISIKIDNGEELTPSESRRFFAHTVRVIGQWEIVFYWNRDGHIGEQSWQDWNQFYSGDIESWLPKEKWVQIRATYAEDFAEHVDRQYE